MRTISDKGMEKNRLPFLQNPARQSKTISSTKVQNKTKKTLNLAKATVAPKYFLHFSSN